MNQGIFTIQTNRMLAPKVYLMQLRGETSGITRPGQFVNIRLDGKFLRRPISVCDSADGLLTIIYKVVGAGTRQMSELPVGASLDVLTGLGNGYDTALSGNHPLLVGGGVGVPPMYKLAKTLIAEGKQVSVVLGFNTCEEVFFEDEFRQLGCEVTVTTVDGSYGVKGFVTNALPEEYTHFYTCGPLPMLRSLNEATVTDGQMSFEERMGCGFGVCVGCTMQTQNGPKRVCKDGPVFMKSEIIFS